MSRLSLIEQALVAYGTRFPNHPRKWWLHERLRTRLGVSVDRAMEVRRQGLRWRLNPADFAERNLFWLGTKDPWDLQRLRSLTRPGDVVVDVGANFGYYGISLARHVAPGGLVHALEPIPTNFDRLRHHIAANHLEAIVRAYRLGAGDRAETVRMHVPEGNSGHAAVSSGGEVADVPLTTLNAFVKAEGLDRVNTVVLDVEGYEERALMGAHGMLERFRPMVVVELFPPVMHEQGSSPEAVARVLRGMGYRLFHTRRRRLIPLETMPQGDVRINAFAIHRDRPAP